jgi:hypothetical protein
MQSKAHFTAGNLDKIYNYTKLKEGKPYPGKYCFVVQLDIFQQMDMGHGGCVPWILDVGHCH